MGQVPSLKIHFPVGVGLCPQTSSPTSVVSLGKPLLWRGHIHFWAMGKERQG